MFCDMNSGHIKSFSFADGMQSKSLGKLSNSAQVEATDMDGDRDVLFTKGDTVDSFHLKPCHAIPEGTSGMEAGQNPLPQCSSPKSANHSLIWERCALAD